VGGAFAAIAEVSRRWIHAADRVEREGRGARSRRELGPLPGWVPRVAYGVSSFLRAHPELVESEVPRGLAMHPGRILEMADGVEVEIDGLDVGKLQLVAERTLGRGAAKDTLGAFFVGTRAWFQLEGISDALPSRLALLSGTLGLEVYDAVAPVRKRWEDRSRQWRDDPFIHEAAEMLRVGSMPAIVGEVGRCLASTHLGSPGPKSAATGPESAATGPKSA